MQAVVTFFSNIVVVCISLSHGYIIAPRLPDVMPVSVSSGTSILPYTYSMLTMAICVQDWDSAVLYALPATLTHSDGAETEDFWMLSPYL